MAEGQEALFEIEGPDEDGCIWICCTEGRKVWFHNLSQWLEAIDYLEDQ